MPTREIYWNIDLHGLLYLFAFAAIALFVWGYYRRYRLWRIGQPEEVKLNVGGAFWRLFDNALIQRRVLRQPYPGLMHLAIFWGFVVLFVGTLFVAAKADIGLPVFHGTWYLVLSAALDLMGLVAIIGVVMALVRRYVMRPDYLENRVEDGLILTFLLTVLVTGFWLEGLRIAAAGDPWAHWTPVGLFFANYLVPTSSSAQLALHQFLWWLHLLLGVGFILALPFTKLGHILVAPLNILFRPEGPKGALATMDLEDETLETFGVNSVNQFTWRQLMQSDACVRCGRCLMACPTRVTGKPLRPMDLIQNLRDELSKTGPAITAARVSGGNSTMAEDSPLEVVSVEGLWSCTTCRYCEEACPVLVEHVDKIVDMRRYKVLMEADMPAEGQAVIRNIDSNGNPWGLGRNTRSNWIEDMEIEIPVLEPGGKTQYLFWVGCAGAFDHRNVKITQALAQVLTAAGVDFAVLGNSETCCGDSARRLGNEYLYQMLAQENIAALDSVEFEAIVTACPHCFNTLRNEYPDLGGDWRVLHHSQLLEELLSGGHLEIPVAAEVGLTVTYHDSCYLGRYNNVYQQPRTAIERLPGVKVREMSQARVDAFCCGAGGGRMWLEETVGDKIYLDRTRQALATNAEAIATACPFCLTMFEDGLKDEGKEDAIPVLDLVELIARRLDLA